MKGYLLLQDGTKFSGEIFGSHALAYGEIVFTTAMTGYEQSLTDPSFRGQILVFTYPLIGNYGVPDDTIDDFGLSSVFESTDIHVRGVVVSEESKQYSHHCAKKSFSDWLTEKNISGISGIDTRALTQKLREHGVMLGQIVPEGISPLTSVPDPNISNLVDEVSCKQIKILEPKKYTGITIAIIDTGIKNNILREFLQRGIRVIQCPWNIDLSQSNLSYDALFLSNGPGNPEKVAPVIAKNILLAKKQKKCVFGICLGNQILALCFGGKTFKMKYGHRGVNQPCLDLETNKAYITSQNHGYAVDSHHLPNGFSAWFENLNDGTIEGIQNIDGSLASVQFHPESCPGPEDTMFLFDVFLDRIRLSQKKK